MPPSRKGGPPVTKLLRSAWTSPAIRSAVALGLGGAAFAVGNLLLARALSNTEYARFALWLALTQIGVSMGPIGADLLVSRRKLDARTLFRQVALTSGLTGATLAVLSGLLYPLDLALLIAMLISITSGAYKALATAHYQSRQRFGISLALWQSSNAVVPIAAAFVFALGGHSALMPAGIVTVGFCAISLVGYVALENEPRGPVAAGQPFAWGEALSVLGFVSAGLLLGGLDRLAIPRFLGLPELATYSVLATIAGSPFQMLHQGVGYALLPSLRNARGPAERRSIFAQEAIVVALTVSFAGAAVLLLTPPIVGLFLAGRYVLPAQLVLAAVCVGALKPVGSLAVATVTALGSSASLAALSVAAWASVATSFAGAWIGAQWGLTGLVYGVGTGWLVRTVIAGWLAARCLQRSSGPTPAQGSVVLD